MGPVTMDDVTESPGRAPSPFNPKDPFREGQEAAQARRRRSIALGLGLVVFVVLIFVVTLARLGGHVADRHF